MDSGDLAYLSFEGRNFFHAIEKEFKVADFGKMTVTASNDLNEETLDALNKQVSSSNEVMLLAIFSVLNCMLCWNEMTNALDSSLEGAILDEKNARVRFQ